jgi:hypothetical protein
MTALAQMLPFLLQSACRIASFRSAYLLIWHAPCLPVALFGWRRASLKRTLAAEAWTVIVSAITVVFVSFSALDDCAEDVIGPVPSNPCHAAKIQAMLVSLAFGATSRRLTVR